MSRPPAKPHVEIYADGACSGNPGPGGWGALLRFDKTEKEISGCEASTTNNRMELLAVITALESLKRPCEVTVATDSSYVVKGMNEWIKTWQKNGWKNSARKDVLNRDLWQRLLKAADGHRIHWRWIRGHDGHPENERCDRLARTALKACGTGT